MLPLVSLARAEVHSDIVSKYMEHICATVLSTAVCVPVLIVVCVPVLTHESSIAELNSVFIIACADDAKLNIALKTQKILFIILPSLKVKKTDFTIQSIARGGGGIVKVFLCFFWKKQIGYNNGAEEKVFFLHI